MTALFMFLVATISCNSMIDQTNGLLNDDVQQIHEISENAESISYATDVELNETYSGSFNYPGQTHYYHYELVSSGYYIALAADSHDILVSYYGSNDNGFTTVLIRQNISLSTNTNFGYEYGNYFDNSEYSDIYIAVSDRYYSSGITYYFTFCNFEKHNTSDFQVMNYDVDSGFYSFVVHPYTYYGGPVTSGYNPNGSSSIVIPSGASGTDITLSVGNGYDTTSQYPYTAIGKTLISVNSVLYYGTGFLIGSKYMATAAHIVIKRDHVYPQISTASIVFGLNDQNSYAAIGHFKKIYYSADYYKYEELPNDSSWAQNDWAICELDDTYGNYLGYLPIINSNQLNYSSSNILCPAGYRGGSNQVLCYGSYAAKYTNTIYSTAPTNSGNSGGPVIDPLNHYVIAIHSHRVTVSDIDYSGGTLFKPTLYSFAQGLIGGNI